MAQAKKKTSETSQAKKKNQDPFKTRKTKETAENKVDTVTPPAEIQRAVDLFRENQEQAKHFEGEATVYKDRIVAFSLEEYCKRAWKGQSKSFKLLGHETIVNYIIQDSSAGLTEEDFEEFQERWGKKAAEEMIVKDYASIRLNGQVLADHYEEIVEALQVLPKDILNQLFKPMLMKAAPNAIEKAKKYTKTAHELGEMIKHLKVKNYIK